MTTEGFWPGNQPAQTGREQTGHDQSQQTEGAPQPPFTHDGGEPAAAAPQFQPQAQFQPQPQPQPQAQPQPEPQQPQVEQPAVEAPAAEPPAAPPEVTAHAPGELLLPQGVETVEGHPDGAGRSVAIVVARFNGEVTNRLLESAIGALAAAGVPADRVTVMPVPGAFELPLGAMALAKTRRFACIVALGCVIRGETTHHEYVAGEAASGLQLAGLETGVPVAFGVLTVDTLEQALARADKGAEAVSSALEMADLFSQIRSSARAAG